MSKLLQVILVVLIVISAVLCNGCWSSKEYTVTYYQNSEPVVFHVNNMSRSTAGCYVLYFEDKTVYLPIQFCTVVEVTKK